MFAIVEIVGKQYRIEKNKSIKVDLISGEKDKEFNDMRVLLYNNDSETLIGKPYLTNVKVYAKIQDHTKGKKIIVFKYKRRKDTHKKQGHRQKYTMLFITDIKAA